MCVISVKIDRDFYITAVADDRNLETALGNYKLLKDAYGEDLQTIPITDTKGVTRIQDKGNIKCFADAVLGV